MEVGLAMTIFDISTELRSAPVYPGDTPTRVARIKSIKKGDSYNLSGVTASLHTGTHIDAPAHFIDGGMTVDEMPLDTFMGGCRVISAIGRKDDLTGADIEELVPEGTVRVLFKTLGECRLTRSAAFALVSAGVRLVGIDAQSVAPDGEESAVHKELLLAGIAILEGLSLRHVQSGAYTLMALPLKIDGVDGAPCRAILMKN